MCLNAHCYVFNGFGFLRLITIKNDVLPCSDLHHREQTIGSLLISSFYLRYECGRLFLPDDVVDEADGEDHERDWNELDHTSTRCLDRARALPLCVLLGLTLKQTENQAVNTTPCQILV